MDGIPIEFVAKSRLQDKDFGEKLDLILDEVRDGKILVLEETLSPQEEGRLIQGAMERAGEDFPGIEFSTLEGHEDVFDRVLNNMYQVVGRSRRRGLTIVGNSEVMEEVEKQEDSVSLLATAEED
ncbi:MAG: DUF2073 domain-containing protein [Candidatus Nanohaloarchaea archaeon]|nr:DUF2073 domain-containing protein [Candidatus Nanohaloarchaea archaeon]